MYSCCDYAVIHWVKVKDFKLSVFSSVYSWECGTKAKMFGEVNGGKITLTAKTLQDTSHWKASRRVSFWPSLCPWYSVFLYLYSQTLLIRQTLFNSWRVTSGLHRSVVLILSVLLNLNHLTSCLSLLPFLFHLLFASNPFIMVAHKNVT